MNRFRSFLLSAVSLAFLAGCAPSEPAKQKASIHFRLGSEYLQRGEATSALREFLEAEKFNPDDASVQFGVGSALNAKGRFQDGLRHYRKALEFDPKFTEVHNAMGSTYLELGQWDDAIKEFEIALKDLLYMTPFFVENNLGWAYYKKGDLPRAIDHYRRALSMKPDFGLAYYNLGLAYKDNKQTDRGRHCGDALRHFPGSEPLGCPPSAGHTFLQRRDTRPSQKSLRRGRAPRPPE